MNDSLPRLTVRLPSRTHKTCVLCNADFLFPLSTYNGNDVDERSPVRCSPPGDNNYVSIDGRLDKVEMDSNGLATRLVLVVDNMSFLGKVSTSTSATGAAGLLYSSSPSH